MFVNKSRNPSASEILSQLFLNKELRSRVLTTLGLLLLVDLVYISLCLVSIGSLLKVL